MSRRRSRLSMLAGAVVLGATAIPAFAVTAGNGRYTPTCPQGWMKACGEAYWTVSHGGKQIDKQSSAPWPNDPASPAIGICGRGNPYALKAIPIKKGAFSYKGVANGKSFTWTGTWVTKKKLKGTVKWAGCATLVKYTATVK